MIQIQHLIDNGDFDTALNQLNTLIEKEPVSSLHKMRLQILSQTMEDISAIRASLDWLKTHDVPVLDDVLETLEPIVEKRLEEITADENEDFQRAVRLVQRYESLADYFPIVHLIYGMFLMHSAQQRRRFGSSSKSPLDILDEILGENKSRAATPLRKDQIETYQKARHHLEQAVERFAEGDERRGLALEGVGEVCELLGERVGAWKAYCAAQAHGNDVEDKLEKLGTALRQDARKRSLDYIDQLLGSGQFELAAKLLAALNSDEAEMRVRRGDLAYLRGDFDDAMKHYSEVLK